MFKTTKSDISLLKPQQQVQQHLVQQQLLTLELRVGNATKWLIPPAQVKEKSKFVKKATKTVVLSKSEKRLKSSNSSVLDAKAEMHAKISEMKISTSTLVIVMALLLQMKKRTNAAPITGSNLK